MSSLQSSVLPCKDKYFRSLLTAPKIAWPTIGLLVFAIAIMVSASVLAIGDQIPLWVAALANGFAMYNLFSVAHDGTHRSLSSNKALNEILGRIAIMMFMPVAPFEAVRWVHMQHHRFTNSALDPDRSIHRAAWWQIPFVWSSSDIYYLIYFLRHGDEQVGKNLRALLTYTAVFVTLVVVLIGLGYGLEVLFLWFLASRVGLFLIACVFVYLPHYPGDISAQEDVYKATTIRKGWEWLLNPLLVYQNYHLIHHLYPTAPFYTYQKIWHLKYDELVSHDPAVQTPFGLQPVNIPVQAH